MSRRNMEASIATPYIGAIKNSRNFKQPVEKSADTAEVVDPDKAHWLWIRTRELRAYPSAVHFKPQSLQILHWTILIAIDPAKRVVSHNRLDRFCNSGTTVHVRQHLSLTVSSFQFPSEYISNILSREQIEDTPISTCFILYWLIDWIPERLEMKSENSSRKLHAVLIPYPAQGHITPFLQLAKKLVAVHGFRITFVNTTHIHDRFMKSRSSSATHQDLEGIEFVTVSDGLPEDHPRLRDLVAFCKVTLEMGPVFEELFTNLLKKTSVTCVIRDRLFVSVHRIARSLDIPVVAFVASSAIAAHCCYNLSVFIAAGILPIPAPPDASTPTMNAVSLTLALPQSDAEAAARSARLTCLPGAAPTLTLEDIPTYLLTHDLEDFCTRFYLEHQNPLFPDCDGILLNTFSHLEGDVLNAMRGSMNEHIFAVGPLLLDAAAVNGVEEVSLAGVRSGLWEEDPVSLSWLDGREPKSVLFVSFGSMVTISMLQMREFAAGLESSNVTVLWAIRPDVIDDTSQSQECQTMFTELVKRTQNRVLLVPWAPQTAVLSHPAVGAFLTHCGWNSTIESISSGVPMLGWPRFADQNANSHYVTSVWKVGLELRQSIAEDGSAVILREEIAEKVTKIMGGSETEDLELLEIRRNARNLQMSARQAVSNGGSSQAALSQFVELITSLRTTDSSKP